MSRLYFACLAVCVALAAAATTASAQPCCVKGNTNDRLEFDFDGDGITDRTVLDFRVNGDDIQNFVATYIAPGSVSPQADCAADMDDDTDVDDVDLVMFVDALLDPTGLICEYVNNCLGGGPLVYEPPHPSDVASRIAYDNTSIESDADPFGLGKTGFFVPNTIIDRIARDFDDIVALSGDFDFDGVPDLTDEGPNQTLFARNDLLVTIYDPLAANTDFECLNAYFGIDSSLDCNPPCSCNGCCLPDPNNPPECATGCVHCVFGCSQDSLKDTLVLYFPTEGRLNIPLIGALYAGAVEDVAFADPDFCIGGVGGERNIWLINNNGNGFWEWTIEHGFQDCFDGCDCRLIYTAFTDELGEQPFVALPPVMDEALPGTCTFFATPTGACCVEFVPGFTDCFEETMDDCFDNNQGAFSVSYLGNGTTCNPAPCGPTGACCLGEICLSGLTADQCTAQSGEYLGDDTSCVGNPCEPFGACCQIDGSGCMDSTLTDCGNNGGVFLGDGTTCETPNICG